MFPGLRPWKGWTINNDNGDGDDDNNKYKHICHIKFEFKNFSVIVTTAFLLKIQWHITAESSDFLLNLSSGQVNTYKEFNHRRVFMRW